MAQTDPETFRPRFRLEMIERLALMTAFQGPVLSGALTVEQSQQNLELWLDTSGANVDRELGALFGDPAQTALYAEEAQAVIGRMKAFVTKLAVVAKEGGL